MNSVEFREIADVVTAAVHDAGCAVPVVFRATRREGAVRKLTRRDAWTVVTVPIAGRPLAQVGDDLVDGAVAAQQLDRDEARLLRARLRGLVLAALGVAA